MLILQVQLSFLKGEITRIVPYARANISAQIRELGFAILAGTEKRKIFTVGVWIRMPQCRKRRSENFLLE
jgi:hypothetical protein